MKHPTLYSFRRCPYAMRARMALAYSEQVVDIREIILRDKPKSMLEQSPKGTVPVLILPDETGWLYEYADIDTLCVILSEILNERGKIKNYGMAAQQHIRNNFSINKNSVSVPEPSTWLLFCISMGVLLVSSKRKLNF